VNSLITRKIRWRGMAYELISSEQTRIVSFWNAPFLETESRHFSTGHWVDPCDCGYSLR